MILAILSAVLGLAMAWQIWSGLRHVCRHEMAKRRARRIEIPAPGPIDELPYEFPDDSGLCIDPEWQPRRGVRENVAIPF